VLSGYVLGLKKARRWSSTELLKGKNDPSIIDETAILRAVDFRGVKGYGRVSSTIPVRMRCIVKSAVGLLETG